MSPVLGAMFMEIRDLSCQQSRKYLQPLAEIIRLDRIPVPARVRLSVVWKISRMPPRKMVRMRHATRFSLIATALLLAVSVFNLPAQADTQSVSGCSGCNGYTFQATLTPTGTGTYHLSYTITNVSGAPATAQSWSLTLFQNGNSISSFSNFSVSDGNTGAYSVLVGKSNNGSNGNCNSSLSDALCVTLSGLGTPSTIGNSLTNNSLTFSFDFVCSSCGQLSTWDFLSHGTCVSGTGNCYAISANGTASSVPEPSVITLLASELVLTLGVVMVFRPTRNRIFRKWADFFRLQPRPTS
jgi:hypothetical protein